MAYKVIKITSEDNHGIYYEELGSISLNYNALSYNEVSSDEQFIHNELSKEVYKFLLKNKSDADLDNIAVIDNSFSNLLLLEYLSNSKINSLFSINSFLKILSVFIFYMRL